MNKLFTIALSIVFLFFASCNSQKAKPEQEAVKKDSVITLKLNTGEQPAMDKEGVNSDYHSNGNKKMEGLIKDGKREGLWQAWYENGILWSEGEYTNGVNNGKSITYFESGKVRYEGKYVNGKKVGDWNYYDEEGKLVKTVKN